MVESSTSQLDDKSGVDTKSEHVINMKTSNSTETERVENTVQMDIPSQAPCYRALVATDKPNKPLQETCPMLPGWYFKVDSTITSVTASKSPTYPTQIKSKSSAKL